jgi:hypothetical protein
MRNAKIEEVLNGWIVTYYQNDGFEVRQIHTSFPGMIKAVDNWLSGNSTIVNDMS